MVFRVGQGLLDKRRECARLRVELDLPSEVIAKRVGLCPSTVYRYLKGLNRKKKGRYALGFWWSEEEMARLRLIYPKSPRPVIVAAFSGRNWTAISRKASELGLHRNPDARLKAAPDVHPVMKQLRARRIFLGWTVKEMAQRTGFSRQRITQMELGHGHANLLELDRWVTALGLKMTVGDPQVIAQPAVRPSGYSMMERLPVRRNPGGSLFVE